MQNRSRLILEAPPAISEGDMRLWASDIAELVEERIAKDFERERAAGKVLKGNTPEHEQAKARGGWLQQKGQMSGDLLAELQAGGFATVRVQRNTNRTRADINFDEHKLRNRVPHAEYYAEQKVAGQRILVVLVKDARMAANYIRDRARDLIEAANQG